MKTCRETVQLACLAALCLAAACDSDSADVMFAPDGGPDAAAQIDATNPSCSYPPPDSPAETCFDMADAIATAATRCGMDYQTNYDGFINAAANGDCGNILFVRDSAELYEDCIPWFCAATCEALQDPSQIPEACQDQLLRN